MKKNINKKFWISLIIILVTSSVILSSCGNHMCGGMKGYRSDVKRGIAH